MPAISIAIPLTDSIDDSPWFWQGGCHAMSEKPMFLFILIVFYDENPFIQKKFVPLQPKTLHVKIMTAVELNSELFFAMGKIAGDERLMKKLLRYAKRLAAQKEDETLLSKEEFMASLERGEEEYRQGKCVRLLPGESVSDMLRRSGL